MVIVIGEYEDEIHSMHRRIQSICYLYSLFFDEHDSTSAFAFFLCRDLNLLWHLKKDGQYFSRQMQILPFHTLSPFHLFSVKSIHVSGGESGILEPAIDSIFLPWNFSFLDFQKSA